MPARALFAKRKDTSARIAEVMREQLTVANKELQCEKTFFRAEGMSRTTGSGATARGAFGETKGTEKAESAWSGYIASCGADAKQ